MKLKRTVMRIVICLDFSSITAKILETSRFFIASIKEAEVYIVHVIDQALFAATTGYEVQLNEDLELESEQLKDLAIHYLGDDIKYVDSYGIPMLRIDELLASIDYDLLIVGTHAKKNLGERLLGGEAEHLLRKATKPVLFIP